MAKKSHLYRRGNQYWYRASVTVAPGQRVDVRIPLRTDSLFVSRWFCSILDVELIKLTGQEQHVLSLFSRRQVAGSKPGIPMSELKTLVKNHFTAVLDDAHRKRQSKGLTDWPPATKFEAIVKSDYIDLLLASRTTRASADIQQADDWLKRQIATGHMTVERAAMALETLKVRASSGDIYPFSKALRNWLPCQIGRQLSEEDEAQLDILMLAGEREIWNEIAGDWRHIVGLYGLAGHLSCC